MVRLDAENLQTFCRTCLSYLEPATVVSEPTEFGINYDIRETPDLSKLLIICTTRNINEESDSPYPQRLCVKCYETLQEFKRFREMAIKSSEVLRGIVENTDGILIGENEQGEKRLKFKYGAKTEVVLSNCVEETPAELTECYSSLPEEEVEHDTLLNEGEDMKVETILSDTDSSIIFDNNANSTTDIIICDREIDSAPTSRPDTKRKMPLKRDNYFPCSLVGCGAVFSKRENLREHWNKFHSTVSRKKMDRIRENPQRKWTDEEVNKILDYIMEKGYVARPSARVFYTTLAEELNIDAHWKLLKCKVNNLKASFLRANEWRKSQKAVVYAMRGSTSVDGKLRKICRYYESLTRIFTNRIFDNTPWKKHIINK